MRKLGTKGQDKIIEDLKKTHGDRVSIEEYKDYIQKVFK
jgi:hypothetical protein